ncbi:MAG: glycosyltransferase family 4 protein [Cyanobacteria bacterium J06634_6]
MKSTFFKTSTATEVYRTFETSYTTVERIQTEGVPAGKQGISKKLSVVTQFFPPDYAATGQLIEELVRHLGAQGIDIKVFSGQPAYAFHNSCAPRLEEHGLVTIVRSRTTQIWGGRLRGKTLNGLLFAVRTALHLIKNCRRRDLVLLTTAPPFLPVLGYLANILLGMPYVCLLYDLYPDIAIELDVVSRKNWIAKCWRSLNRRVWMRAQELIVLSPDMKQRIVNLCPKVEGKTHVIHSWADHEKIIPIAKADNWFAQEHNLVNKFTVLYSGNMGRCHDIDTIFEAALKLKNEPIQFVCIGSGAKRDQLIAKVNKHKLSNFLFLPYQPKSALPYSLTACDLSLVSVNPGMESLVAPSKVYSALASGRPIAAVCPPHTYLKDMLETSNSGAWFDNGDSQGLATFIKALSQNSYRVKSMGHAARRYLENNYTPEIIAEQYADILVTSSVSKSLLR